MKLKVFWHLWALSMGEKAHKNDKVADKVAIIRTFIFITYLITNCFIIAGVIRHWNSVTVIELHTPTPTPSSIRVY